MTASRFIVPGDTVGSAGSTDQHVVTSVFYSGVGRSGILLTFCNDAEDKYGVWAVDTSGSVRADYMGAEDTARSVYRTTVGSILRR